MQIELKNGYFQTNQAIEKNTNEKLFFTKKQVEIRYVIFINLIAH
jgi:hypothetical protein